MASLNGEWWLAPDPGNVGREQRWFAAGPVADARKVAVPGLIQETFPAQHGVFWFWRAFSTPLTTRPGARYLVRFGAVEYLAEVWLNGVPVGRHEGPEFPFNCDVTAAIRSGVENVLVVRVLNPTNDLIDDIRLAETPNRTRAVPATWGRCWDTGGIVQPVDLLCVPSLRVADLFVRPQGATGRILITATVHNDTPDPIRGNLQLAISPAAAGGTLLTAHGLGVFAPGDTQLESDLQLDEPHLWSVEDPYLYRVTAVLEAGEGPTVGWADERSVRCGLRDFRFENGYFRLNGRRIFLRSAHRGNFAPFCMSWEDTLELQRRDYICAKAMGFNMVRLLVGAAYPEQLDLCDELGLMVYEESFASWMMQPSARLAERFDRSTAEMILRDRNHPCVTIWGLLNETADGLVFRHAVETLPLVRSLDETRLVLLSSGRFDGQLSVGSLSNPGSAVWEYHLGAEAPGAPASKLGNGGYVAGAGDVHFYCGVPLSRDSIRFLRTLGESSKPIFLSEHGNGSQEDPIRICGLMEQAGARPDDEDYIVYRAWADRYQADWRRLGLDAMFAAPSDLVRQGQRLQSELRAVGLSAIRSNPHLVGYSLTAMGEETFGEGLWTFMRELKPGIAETMREGWAPLRWCLFVEPVHGYRGRPFRVEAVLANEDVLRPGAYPVHLRISGPAGPVWERSLTLQVPGPTAGAETPFVLPVFSEEVCLDGPAGQYKLVAWVEHSAAPAADHVRFFLSDPIDEPLPVTDVTVFGASDDLLRWLQARRIACRTLAESPAGSREAILVGPLAGASGDLAAFRELAKRMARGSTAVFMSPQALKRGDDALGWLPLAVKGALRQTQGWATGRDDFARGHPIFSGLPANGLLDPVFYRDLIPGRTFDGQEPAPETIAGALAIPCAAVGGYYCGAHIAVWPFGAGRFVVNTLLVLENLGRQPAADRLLLNLIRFASEQEDTSLAPLPSDLDQQMTAIGYH